MLIRNSYLMTCFEFKMRVKDLSDDLHYIESEPMLDSVHYLLRQRFIDTLIAGFDLAETFEIINISSKLPDIYFFRFLKFQKNRRISAILL